MATVTVRPQANDEDGFIRFGVDNGMGEGDITTFTTNARIKIGRHDGNNSLGDMNYDPDTYFGWMHLKGAVVDGISEGFAGITEGSTINSAKLYVYYHASNTDSSGMIEDAGEGFTVAAQNVVSASKPTSYADVAGWVLHSTTVSTGSLIDGDEGEDEWGMGSGSPNESWISQFYPTQDDPTVGLEIKTIIQAIVNKSGWSATSNINLKLTPAALDYNEWDIEWKDYDNKTSNNYHPKLVIDFTAAAASTPTSESFLLFLD